MIKRFFRLALLTVPLMGLSSCLFDSSDSSGEARWLDDAGVPLSYAVRTLTVPGTTTLAASVALDSTPTIQSYRVALGESDGMKQVMLFDFAFRDSELWNKIRAAGAKGKASLTLHLDSTFYATVAKDRLPLSEELQFRYSWKQDLGSGSAYLDSIGKIRDSVWVNSWVKPGLVADSADTVFALATQVARDSLVLPLPGRLVEAILSAGDAQRLQLAVSLVDASRILRFRSLNWNNYSVPVLRIKADTLSKTVYSFRIAQQTLLTESSCADCLVLHGGIRESLVVDINAQPLLDALSDFYQDDFPLQSEADVRQAVVMAELAIPRSASMDGSELNMPVPVFASALIDSLQGDGSYWSYSEGYKLDTSSIKKNGHPNLLFFPGDSLKVQVTGALRRYINTAGLQGTSFRVTLRMGRPMRAPYSLYYYDYTDDDGEAVYVFADNSAFSRYDFASSLAAGAPVRLKLWLASTRGGEQ